MDLDLTGTRVIVTAGAAGIGRAIVEGFLAEGARVATCDIDEAALATLPEDVFARRVDVADAGALRQFVGDAAQSLGGLDCLVNNAGIAGPTARIEDIGLDQWEATLAICLTSQFVTTGAAVPLLRESANPSIVNISSVAGRVGFRLRTPYAAAKWGVIGLTKSLALELGGDGIRSVCVIPGNVRTPRQLKWYTPEGEAEIVKAQCLNGRLVAGDIAAMILFLASDDARLVTGHSFFVDAGWR